MISEGGINMEGNVINMNSYQERRKKFAKTVAYDGEIQVPNKRREEERIQPERYRTRKSNREKLTQKQKRLAKAKLWRNRALAVGLAGTIVFGGFKAWNEYRDSKNTLTLEQALEHGKTLEKLGINEEIATEIGEYTTKLEGDLTNKELIDIAEEIPDIQMKVIKTKMANKIEDVNLSDIDLIPADRFDTAKMYIEGQGVYEREGIINSIIGDKMISVDIADYIDRIDGAQEKERKMKKGDINREQDIKYYRKAIKEISKFAAGEIEIDKKGNISIEKTRVSELEKAKEKDEGFGLDD